MFYAADGVTGTNKGGGDFTPGFAAGLGVFVPLGDSMRLVIEPYLEGTPGFYFLPEVRPGLGVSLNL